MRLDAACLIHALSPLLWIPQAALLALGVAYMLVPVYLTWRRPAASLGRAAYSQHGGDRA